MKYYKYLSLAILLLLAANIAYSQYVEVPDDAGQINNKIDLNGTWYFNPTLKNVDASSANTAKNWSEIQVPGEWLMQGFKVEAGKQAGYFREFKVPADWKDYAVYLRCDAVFSKVEVAINGKNAGSHTGPMVAFEKDVTDLINAGKTNRIAMGIVAETLADTLMSGTQYAAHQLGGILRKIYLVAVPKVHLRDLWIKTEFDAEYNNARLLVSGELVNKSKLASASVSAQLIDPDGNTVTLDNSQNNYNINKKSSSQIELIFPVDSPVKWDAEHPNLYQLKLIVSSDAGSEEIVKNVGFRQIEVIGNQLFVNGCPVKLKGVNRHEVHPLRGRSLTAELWEQDAKLFKAGNVNYIRTSHYPPSEEFIEWCDKIGLYVELENPIAWIGHGANSHWQTHDPHDPALYAYLESISKSNIEFFRNHPSIIIWSMANESAWGPNWAKLADFFAKKDPTRPASFHDQAYGGFNNFGSTKMPVANIHYPGPAGPGVAENFERPLLFGEYAHLNTYNRSEIVTDPGVRDSWGNGFKDMFEGMYKSRGCLGGAIWSGIDDVFYLPDGRSVGYGEWGPIDGWRREKPEYFHMKKSYSPVKIHNRVVAVPSVGKGIELQVENRFDFTNLSECAITWKLDAESGMLNMNLAPHNFGILTVQPKTKELNGKLLEVKFVSPQGIEVETCVIEIGDVKRDDIPFFQLNGDKIDATEHDKMLTIDGNGFSWKFDLSTGKLENAKVGNEQILNGGVELMLLSLKTGECLTEHSLQIPFHNETCSNWNMKKATWSMKNDTVEVVVAGSYTEAEGELVYRFSKDATLDISYQMTAKSDINPRQWGLVFSSAENMNRLEWYRKGLWSYYPENHIGRTHGETVPFGDKAFRVDSFGKAPSEDWRYDANELGTNDFRATRENIYWASLSNSQNKGLAVVSDGSQAFRAFMDGGKVNFLVAGFSTGGGDMFFSSHLQKFRRPLKDGDKFGDEVKIKLVNDRNK